jgi:glycosyltransferase involved in cell wall biosynthesis
MPSLHSLLRRKPRFSIVLATKNGMPFVREAVASLEAQTNDDYEVVIQDAASTDGTAEFLSQLRLSRVCAWPLSRTAVWATPTIARFHAAVAKSSAFLTQTTCLFPNTLETVEALFLRRPSPARLRRRRVRPVLGLGRCVRQQHRADASRRDQDCLDQPREPAR